MTTLIVASLGLHPVATVSLSVPVRKIEVKQVQEVKHLPEVADKPLPVLPQATGFKYGNCTFYAAKRRSELGKPVTWHGNARAWLANARAQGWVTGTTPRVGAIYVSWVENSRGTNSGHVGIVEKVEEGKYLISEMNYVGYNKVSYRWLSTASTEKGFIY